MEPTSKDRFDHADAEHAQSGAPLVAVVVVFGHGLDYSDASRIFRVRPGGVAARRHGARSRLQRAWLSGQRAVIADAA